MTESSYTLRTVGSRSAAEQWSQNLTADQQDLAKAWTAAYRAGGELAKVRLRQTVAEAGFSLRFQNAIRVNVYPARKDSLRPAIWMYHKIPYAGVFQDGETIRGGQGRLWIPVPGLATRGGRGGERLSPITFERLTGQKLIAFRNPHTGNLLLGVRIRVPKKGLGKISLSRLRRGEGGKQGTVETVPVFTSAKQVHINQKFNLDNAMDSVEAQLPQLFIANMGTI